jgi:hypothetical protein
MMHRLIHGKRSIIFRFFLLKPHRSCYDRHMKKQSLLKTNIFLKDRSTRDRLLLKTVLSSSTIEGVVKSANRALEAEQKQSNPLSPHEPAQESF